MKKSFLVYFSHFFVFTFFCYFLYFNWISCNFFSCEKVFSLENCKNCLRRFFLNCLFFFKCFQRIQNEKRSETFHFKWTVRFFFVFFWIPTWRKKSILKYTQKLKVQTFFSKKGHSQEVNSFPGSFFCRFGHPHCLTSLESWLNIFLSRVENFGNAKFFS